MTDHEAFRSRPQRQAVPRMLIFLATIAIIAIAIVIWFVLDW